MRSEHVALIESLLQNVVNALGTALRDTEMVKEILVAEGHRGGPAPRGNGALGRLINDARFTVRWNGCECRLGPTVSYRLLRRLAARPNHYVPHEELIEDVWGDPRSSSALRSAVFELRRKLSAGGLGELAEAIDGENAGHYALRLERIATPDGSDRHRTRFGR